jgi:type IV pilus assembly protein PilC
MASFSYSAVNQKGDHISGTIDASDRSVAVKTLTTQGLRPLSVKEVAESTTMSVLKLFGGGKVKNDQIVIFTRELSAMVGAGVPILKALTSLHDHSESQALKKVLVSIIKDVEGGDQLGDALSKYPNTFSDVYVNMVRAGEAAGILDDILKRLAYQQEKNATIRKKIKSAMTYPMVLVGITILAFFGLMLFVIPQIGKILTDLGGPDAQLPLLTQVMLAISGIFVNFWFILFPLMAAAVYMILKYLKTPSGKSFLHHLVLRIPGLKTIVMKIAVGQTDTVLVKVADFFEEEVDVAIEGISAIIEPVMIVFMGGMVGLIAASVMLPIASLSSSIK